MTLYRSMTKRPMDATCAESRSLIPAGFELTAHSIFQDVYRAPRLIKQHSLPPPEQSDDMKEKEEEEEEQRVTCTICLGVRMEEPVTINCLHSYCKSCIMEWFKSSLTCPLCKQDGGDAHAIFFVQANANKGGDSCKLFRVSEAGGDSADDGGSAGVWPIAIRPQIRAALARHKSRFVH